MISVTRRLEFDAGHRIPDHRSQCRNMHGHRYVLEITLTGDIVQAPGESDNGMLMDFADIKRIAKAHIVDVWDHAFLVFEEMCIRDRTNANALSPLAEPSGAKRFSVSWPLPSSHSARTVELRVP